MNISNMCVAVRPLSTAQAVDLGTMMARHWFVPLWKIWMGVALPFFIVLCIPMFLIGGEESMLPMLGGLLFWWCKPLYEKPMVSWLGHALFGAQPEVKDSIKNGLKSAHRYGLLLLLFKRLSPYRQLIMPILMLEHPDKKQCNKRLTILGQGQGGGLAWHTIVLVHIEGIVSLAVIILLSLLVPTYLMSFETYFNYLQYTSGWVDFARAVLYFLTASVIAPFFVAGGFAVYLTKRCLFEGWDIELIFKQLARRYEQSQTNPLTGLTANQTDGSL